MKDYDNPAIWFTVDDVRREYEALRARGVAFTSNPFRIRTGIADYWGVSA